MRTTIDIHAPLLERAKNLAEARGKRLSDVVNDALLEMLEKSAGPGAVQEKFQLLTYGRGGTQPGIDLSSNAGLLDQLAEDNSTPTTSKADIRKLR